MMEVTWCGVWLCHGSLHRMEATSWRLLRSGPLLLLHSTVDCRPCGHWGWDQASDGNIWSRVYGEYIIFEIHHRECVKYHQWQWSSGYYIHCTGLYRELEAER